MKKIVIIGRPNVGKSTLFNRLAGRKVAIVDDTPGVTRDRKEVMGRLFDLEFIMIDTAGLERKKHGDMSAQMLDQTSRAIDEADVIIFMYDVRVGVTQVDKEMSRWALKSGKQIVLVANKAEARDVELSSQLGEAYVLGLGNPIPISSEHGTGLDNLYLEMKKYICNDENHNNDNDGKQRKTKQELTDEEKESLPIRVAIVGRPNAGKSTLINKIIGDNRLITSDIAGTTRDSVDVYWEYQGKKFTLVDTAGMRKKSKVMEKIEQISVQQALHSINYAQVCVLLVDATMPLEKQDLAIAKKVIDEGRIMIVALNKWDLIPGETKQKLLDDFAHELKSSVSQVKQIRFIPVSAKEGKNIHKIFDEIINIYPKWSIRISTAKLNYWLDGVVQKHPPPLANGRTIKIKYVTQIKTRPPTFVFFVSKPVALPTSYMRYLINNLREEFDLFSVPIRYNVRSGKNPYADNSK